MTVRPPTEGGPLPLMYTELVPWYRLVDPIEDHEEEAACFQAAFERAVTPAPETLLELGAGAGHNAAFLSRRFRCTLTDRSPEMLALARELDPTWGRPVGDGAFDQVFLATRPLSPRRSA